MARRPRELTPDRSARHLFGSEVRRHRELAGMSLERLAEVVRYSRSHLSRVEVAEHVPPPDLAARLDAAFGTDGHFERLYSLARHEAHPDKYRRRMELEARARLIQEFAGHFVPGLVQTEAYARALFQVTDPRRTESKVEEMVTARMIRQARLQAESPPDVSFILDESVLCRPVGSVQAWRAQLAALAAIVDTPTSIVQVLPFQHGAHALMGGGLALFTLGNGTTVAYEESCTSGQLLEDPEFVHGRCRAYDLIRAYALSPRATADLINTYLKELAL